MVTSLENIRYLSGFTGSTAYMLVGESFCRLFTDFRYGERAVQEISSSGIDLVVYNRRPLERIARDALKAGIERLGFEGEQISFYAWRKLEENLAGRCELILTRSLIKSLRAIKDKYEIESLRKATLLVGRVLENILENIKPGVEERLLTAELEYRLRRKGAESPAFEPVVASGAHSSMPHAKSSRESLKADELLLIDIGAVVDGYCSDVTRVFFLGKPTSRANELFALVRKAQEVALGVIEPGISCAEVDRAAREVIQRSGYGAHFGHGLGHGVGLEVHEAPTLGRESQESLKPGMVFTVEPGIYLKDWGGIRFEDTVLLTDKGPEVLSDYFREEIITIP